MALPKYADIWLPGYIKSRMRALGASRPARVWVAITDHYEPFWKTTDDDLARRRVAVWSDKWPAIASRHTDSAGQPPKYCFFYPEEEYKPYLLDPLAEMTSRGIGDVEIHIHHNGEGAQNFIDRMGNFANALRSRHGLLHQENGRAVFGFIHGNWCLDNSRPDGAWCGLNNEIHILRDLGCYADFTMPSGPSPTQARLVNTIYWATDDPERPKSYDNGVAVRPGHPMTGDLLMIPGPFGLSWSERFPPRIEIGELAAHSKPSAARVRRWFELAPRLGADVFIKLFTHGTQEKNSAALLDGGLDETFRLLSDQCRQWGCELRYATAWEMYQAVLQLQNEATR